MTREMYESISLHDLREIAKNRGMRRISALKKADLIEMRRRRKLTVRRGSSAGRS